MTTQVTTDRPLVEVQNLSVRFPTAEGVVHAVDNVTFSINKGEIVGLVGESASGKSTLGLSLLRAVPLPGESSAQRLTLEDRDLSVLTQAELRKLRSAEISLVVQDALATMNPVLKIGEQVTRILKDHGVPGGKRRHRELAIQALAEVQLPNPEDVMRRYPHELSGGMQQRVAIAQGLILGPKLIVADEPTTALDVTVQAQILALLQSITAARQTSIIFVTHDLATVAEICDRVMVMYAGRIVESGAVVDVFKDPQHPYTRALLDSLLPLGGEPPKRLDAIPGQPPRPGSWPEGCRFRARCPLYQKLGNPDICIQKDPEANETQEHWAACHFAERTETP